METLGSAIDKMMTANFKIYYNLETGTIQKLTNLQQQRNALSTEIDKLATELLTGKVSELDAVRPQHKTY